MNTESLTLRLTIIVHGAFQRIFFYKPKIVSHTNTKHHIKSRLMHKIKFKSWGEPKFLTPCFHMEFASNILAKLKKMSNSFTRIPCCSVVWTFEEGKKECREISWRWHIYCSTVLYSKIRKEKEKIAKSRLLLNKIHGSREKRGQQR